MRWLGSPEPLRHNKSHVRRFASTLPLEQIARMFGIRSALPNLAPNWNVAPSQRAAVVRRHAETAAGALDLLTWGLVPHFTKDLKTSRRPINARAGTVAISGMFRGALASRRCVVPADAFYEWQARWLIQEIAKVPIPKGYGQKMEISRIFL